MLKTNRRRFLGALQLMLALSFGIVTVPEARADDLTPAQVAKLETFIKTATTWAKDPVIVGAVKALNAKPRDTTKAMTQEQWSKLTVMDPIVKEMRSNEAGKLLTSHKSDQVSEAFVSIADGTKAAFIAKPSNWSHKGKPKHDQPMDGKVWKGKPEKDDSTGLQSVQFSVPVLDGSTPIGSLVVGISVGKL